MKKPEVVMEILEAYDLTGSFRAAAGLVGCEGSYVTAPSCAMVARGHRSPSRDAAARPADARPSRATGATVLRPASFFSSRPPGG